MRAVPAMALAAPMNAVVDKTPFRYKKPAMSATNRGD